MDIGCINSCQIVEIEKNETHVWVIDLRKYIQFHSLFIELLSADECNRIKFIHRSEDCAHFVVCRGILRKILERYTSIAAKELSIVIGIHEKPMLSGPSSVNFNVSHSGDWFVVALNNHSYVGIDIELIQPLCRAPARLASMFMSRSEYKDVINLAQCDQPNAFYRTWVFKESILKALGIGLSFEMRNIVTDIDSSPVPRVLNISRPYCEHKFSSSWIDIWSNYWAAVTTISDDISYKLISYVNTIPFWI